MKISGCYIVKNEAAGLKRSMESIKEAVDEVLVVDTGSTDDTVAVAETMGAKVLSYPWQEDFAAARNFVLDNLTGDWTVFIDGDEYFSSETAPNIRAVIARAEAARVDMVLVPWDNVEETTGERLLLSYAPRIFRLDKGLRYVGRIHEELCRDGRPVENVITATIDELRLMHTGYSEQLSKEKAARNLRLLQKDLQNPQRSPNLYMYLAECYEGLGDKLHAKHYAKLDIQGGRRPIVFASRSYRLLLKILATEPHNWQERLKVAQEAVATFPELPEFRAEYAAASAFACDFTVAVRLTKEAEEIYAAAKQKDAASGYEPIMFEADMLATLKKDAALWQELAQRKANIKISACVMVKNDAKDLPRWLSASREYAHERLVLDTGSEDVSRELAEKDGCRIFDFPWQDDFALARNAILAKATGDWVVMLDADETFYDGRFLSGFLPWVEKFHPEAEAVELIIHNVDEDDNDREAQRIASVRIFKNLSGMNYRGRVHETLYYGDRLPQTYVEPYRFHIRHTGYSTRRNLAKARRNLKLLAADIEAKGLSEDHYRYLATTYVTLGNLKLGLSYALLAAKAKTQGRGAEGEMYYLALRCLASLGEPRERQVTLAREAVARFPALPDFYAMLGHLLRDEAPEEALSLLQKSLKLYAHPSQTKRPTASQFAVLIATVHGDLAYLYGKKGLTAMTETEIKTALELDAYSAEALDELYELHREEGQTEILARLMAHFPDTQSGLTHLTRWTEQAGLIDMREYVASRASLPTGEKFARFSLYHEAKVGNPVKAYEATLHRLADDVPRLTELALKLEQQGDFPGGDLGGALWRAMPQIFRPIWEAYFEWETGDFSLEDYRFVRNIALVHGSEAQAAKFALLGARFSWQEAREAVAVLLQHERYEAAYAVLSEVPGDSEAVDGAFWREAGLCLYHLGERAAAKECLGRAREAGYTAKDIEIYEAWLEAVGI
ncbi:MAG: glycosyltransferase [Selenomonadaceae bacterium]|nr:glycosyltransferase [Selenomonadaceae bacterium]